MIKHQRKYKGYDGKENRRTNRNYSHRSYTSESDLQRREKASDQSYGDASYR